MSTKRHERTLGAVARAVGGLAISMAAAIPALAAGEEEGVGSTYARVRYLEGSVTIVSATEGREAEATVNAPLAPSDRVQTQDGRAEVELADGSVLWLDDNSRVDLRNLADINNSYEKSNLLALPGGAIRLEAVEPESKDKVFRIDTPHGSVYLLSGGSFRVDADADTTTVSSFRGVAEVSGDDGSVLVRSGEMSRVDRDGTPTEPRAFNTLRTDDFDRFCETRQAAYTRREGTEQQNGGEPAPETLPYEVQPYASELSYYGGWYNVPSYGWVWRPTYYGAWGPYMNGYWTWCPTGWSWVSYDPWGWAPYHYGRWDVAVGIGWVWIPGRAWSGAWVSFAVGSSYVGWCPLNYYNYPVYYHSDITHVTYVNSSHLHGRGWHFVPTDRFSDRRGSKSAVPAERLPRDTDFVLSGRLPRFEPKDIAGRPERGRQLMETVQRQRVPLPVVTGEGGKPAPFKGAEGVGRTAAPRRQPGGGSAAGAPSPRGGGRPAAGSDKRTGGHGQSEGGAGNPHNGRSVPPPRPQPDTRPPQNESKPAPRGQGSDSKEAPNRGRLDRADQRPSPYAQRPQRVAPSQAAGTGRWSPQYGGSATGGFSTPRQAGRPMRNRPEQVDPWSARIPAQGGRMQPPASRLQPPSAMPPARQPDRVVGRFFQGVRRESSPPPSQPGFGRQPATGGAHQPPPRSAPPQSQGQSGRPKSNHH